MTGRDCAGPSSARAVTVFGLKMVLIVLKKSLIKVSANRKVLEVNT